MLMLNMVSGISNISPVFQVVKLHNWLVKLEEESLNKKKIQFSDE